MIFVSVAHSSKAPGAVNEAALIDEHTVSYRASLALHRKLHSAGVGCILSDCGHLDPSEYSKLKPRLADAAAPLLALEIHLNSSLYLGANYSEVIHHPASKMGQAAAESIAERFKVEFQEGMGWPAHGARPNDPAKDGHWDFFITQPICPAIIIEPMFISNAEQASWIVRARAELLGSIVADGILNWLSSRKESPPC